jgi:hypothetical protein
MKIKYCHLISSLYKINKLHIRKTIFSVIISFLCGSKLFAISFDASKYYIKGVLGYGAAQEKIHVGYTEDNEKVYLPVGGGLNIGIGFGYNVSPSVRGELDIGSQSAVLDPEVENGEGFFNKYPITCSVIYHFLVRDKVRAYAGFGAGRYLYPSMNLEFEDISYKLNYKYKSSMGWHTILGVILKKWQRTILFSELRYEFGITYRFKEGEISGVKIDRGAVFKDLKELSGDNVRVNIGVAYYCF